MPAFNLHACRRTAVVLIAQLTQIKCYECTQKLKPTPMQGPAKASSPEASQQQPPLLRYFAPRRGLVAALHTSKPGLALAPMHSNCAAAVLHARAQPHRLPQLMLQKGLR